MKGRGGLFGAAFLMMVMMHAAPAQTLHCDNDQILNADGSGRLIHMTSGLLFQVYPGQNTKSIFWTPLDRVVVCGLGGSAYRITNLSRKGGSVQALRQF